jgi:site-specific recombinase XerD
MPYVFVPLPIKEKLNQFRIFMEDHEYRESTILSYLTYVSKFLRSDYYDEKVSNLADQINEFLKNETLINSKTLKYCRAALYAFYKSLTNTKYPRIKQENGFAEIENLLFGFQEFQKNVKHLTNPSVISEANQVRPFLDTIYQQSHESFNISNICALDIRNYFTREAAHLKPSTKGRVATSIRNFFQYLRFSRVNVDDSIFKIPLSPATWKLNSIPTVLSDQEFQSLSNSFDKSYPSGIRDYSIAVCFIELGLRCAEVARLTLDDFDWKNGVVNIKNTKTHVDRALPISSTFGEAIVNYLQNSRPSSPNRILFVRFSHVQGEPMGREQIRNVIRRSYKRAGISESITGTHILRRTVASKIYKKGASLKMVADILGHECLESTAIYTKIDVDALLKAAGIWPGGGSL